MRLVLPRRLRVQSVKENEGSTGVSFSLNTVLEVEI